MIEYTFRMGDKPKGYEEVGRTPKGYPIYEDKRARKIIENPGTEKSTKPPKGYNSWYEYYREINRSW